MHFEEEPPTPAPRKLMSIYNESNYQLKRVEEEETNVSSEEISEEEEEDEEEKEFKRIQDMEEKYLQQNSAKTLREINSVSSIRSSATENEIDDTEKETENDEFQTESENEREEKQKSAYVQETDVREEYLERDQTNKEVPYSESTSELFESSKTQVTLKENSLESQAQNNLMQLIQSSLTNLQILSSNDKEEQFLKETRTLLLNEDVNETIEATNIINPEKIALAVVNALKSTGITNLKSLSKQETKNEELIKKTQENNYKKDQEKTESNDTNKNKESEIEIVEYKDDYEGEEEFEVEEIQNNEHVPNADNDNYDDDQDVYYDAHFDYRITSKTPTSFNSDDYIFHANFIKQFHRTNSTDKLRVKPHPRKSMSFSNERMREIERHNQILLRKILTQKPSYTLKSKTSQSSVQKIPSQTNTRLTTSAVNRKKQQRQIDLDNQVLKRKIEAIAGRRRPLIS
ncbi:protein hemingway [Lucilia sericata]|uniref:protein hemingway n=1 Tax=Lucilia sericata TaxID=13632 RepID=UPI0018A80096|nr:protein hemingway [Lucilia sericata]